MADLDVGTSPRLLARIAGVFYLLTILTGALVLYLHGALRLAADIFATACYLGVTIFLYILFKPVNRNLSLFAVSFNILGLAVGRLNWQPRDVNLEFVFVGLFCLLIGYLAFKSAFLPRILGALMVFGGLGYLTFFSPSLASHISPYNLAPGGLGQGALTLWLLVFGVNSQRWKERAAAAAESRPQGARAVG